jgi:isocitrate dehydrogenase kinase/phosphatase
MKSDHHHENRLAEMAARTIAGGFEVYHERFDAITARAKTHFEQREWHTMMADMGERLELHSVEVDRVIARLRWQIGAPIRNADTWKAVKAAFSSIVATHRNRELAETFFNSTSRRVLSIVGKNPDTEFDSEESQVDPANENPRLYRRHEWAGDTPALVQRILDDCRFAAPFENLARDANAVAREIDDYVARNLGSVGLDAIDVIRPLFFRQKLAYVIGRIRKEDRRLPLVLSLRNTERGIAVDAVLTTPSELSIVFSFTRSHFHVATDCPRDLVVFLKSVLPLKPVAELYIALGFHKHGKTELYRSLRDYLSKSVDRFDYAAGEHGMVMLVFTLPNYDVVFKVIRDRFPPPKNVTREDVLERYDLVFTHDRVGRLVEAQEFKHLEFDAAQFRPELLEELKREARSSVRQHDGTVVLRHVYVERKVTPLNLYLREADAPGAHEAIADYGQAVKELATANIFPGDFLLKNFGVTRHGRVVFYDYDELGLITDCNFRRMPEPRHWEDELADEPWFSVGERDIFPEEFSRFLGLDDELRAELIRVHGDLFDVAFWRDAQDRLRIGEIMDVYPYPDDRRLHSSYTP